MSVGRHCFEGHRWVAVAPDMHEAMRHPGPDDETPEPMSTTSPSIGRSSGCTTWADVVGSKPVWRALVSHAAERALDEE